MDLSLSPAEAACQQEFSSWLKANLPENQRAASLRGLSDEESLKARREWERTLGAGGWLGVSVPREFGGRGATARGQVTSLGGVVAAMDTLKDGGFNPNVIELLAGWNAFAGH